MYIILKNGSVCKIAKLTLKKCVLQLSMIFDLLQLQNISYPLQSPHNSLHIFSLQVQRFLHDILLDQLSPLVELKLWLAKLAVSNPPVNTRRPLLLEVVPQVIAN